MIEEIRKELFQLQDKKYREMQGRLLPTLEKDTIIGVRTPALRSLAKKWIGREETEAFLGELPHAYFDENQLHAFLLSEIRDYETCLRAVDAFLPFVDNWATCDQLSPKAFKKHRQALLSPIRRWIESGQTYTVRFGVGMLMAHYLDDLFDPKYPEWVSRVRSEEYYVNMMIAWYFATALAKQYDAVIPYLENSILPPWTHNKTIQKAVESYRIAPEQKEYLRALKRKEKADGSGPVL